MGNVTVGSPLVVVVCLAGSSTILFFFSIPVFLQFSSSRF